MLELKDNSARLQSTRCYIQNSSSGRRKYAREHTLIHVHSAQVSTQASLRQGQQELEDKSIQIKYAGDDHYLSLTNKFTSHIVALQHALSPNYRYKSNFRVVYFAAWQGTCKQGTYRGGCILLRAVGVLLWLSAIIGFCSSCCRGFPLAFGLGCGNFACRVFLVKGGFVVDQTLTDRPDCHKTSPSHLCSCHLVYIQ